MGEVTLKHIITIRWIWLYLFCIVVIFMKLCFYMLILDQRSVVSFIIIVIVVIVNIKFLHFRWVYKNRTVRAHMKDKKTPYERDPVVFYCILDLPNLIVIK